MLGWAGKELGGGSDGRPDSEASEVEVVGQGRVEVEVWDGVGLGGVEGHDAGLEPGIRSEDAVVAMTMHSRGRNGLADGIELVEKSVATEVAEDALLDERLHLSDVIGRQVMALVELDLAVVGLAEHAVEDDEVVMRVDVERRAEAIKEADGSELGARRRSWARATERRANRAQQDLEYGAGDAHVVVEIRTEALWDRQHPLPRGNVR